MYEVKDRDRDRDRDRNSRDSVFKTSPSVVAKSRSSASVMCSVRTSNR
jgi:hypothetical protein